MSDIKKVGKNSEMSIEDQEKIKLDLFLYRPTTQDELKDWFKIYLDLDLPDSHLEGEGSNTSPMEAVWESFNNYISNNGSQTPGFIWLSSRDSMKTLGATMLATALMVFCDATICWLASIEPQSKIALNNIQSFIQKLEKYLKHHGKSIESNNARNLEIVESSGKKSLINILVATMSSVNGRHVNIVMTDEVDLVRDPRVLDEVQAVASLIGNQFPLKVYFSTRKFAWGNMNSIIEKSDALGLKILKWDILDVTEYCDVSRRLTDTKTETMYIHPEPPLRAVEQDEYDKFLEPEKKQYEKLAVYPGCKSCKLVSQCKTRLADRNPNDKGMLWKKIDHTINMFRSMSPDMASAQLLCFGEETQILMGSGISKSIKDVKVGDFIVTHTGKIQKVTEVFKRRHTGKSFMLNHPTYSGFSPVIVTPEHPYFINGKEFSEIKDIQPFVFVRDGVLKTKGNYFSTPISYEPIKNTEIRYQDFVDKSLTLEKGRIKTKRTVGMSVPEKYELDYDFGWIVGYYLAEGFLSKKTYKNGKRLMGITFCSDVREKEYHLRVFNFASKIGLNASTFKTKIGNGYVVHIYNNTLAELFLSLCGEYSDKKRLHPDLMSANLDFLKGILEGFDAGDGTKRFSSNKELTTTSYSLASQFFLIASRLGLCPRISKTAKYSGKQPYRVWYQNTNFVGKQKRTKFKLTDGYNLYRYDKTLIEEIEYDGDVFNIEVEGDHSYIVNGVAVHNCKKPSLSGLVYPRFIELENTINISDAYMQLTGDNSAAGSATYADLIRLIKSLEIPIYVGVDWGSTAAQAFVVTALLPNGDWWILETYAITGMEFDEILELGKTIRDRMAPKKWFADTNQPIFIKAFNKNGMKCTEFKKDVTGGIECVRGRIVDSFGIRRLKVLKDPQNPSLNQTMILGLKRHHFILDALAKPTKDPDDGEEWSDICDALRYIAQNLFSVKQGFKPIIATQEEPGHAVRVAAALSPDTHQVANTVNTELMKQEIANRATDTEIKQGGDKITKKKIFWGST